MKIRRSNQLPNNLPQLQNLLKRDPQSYREDFLQQLQHFQSTLSLFLLDPGRNNHELESVIMFLANVAHCYKKETEGFPCRLMDVLKDHQSAIHAEMRLAFCRALILMRNKGLVPAVRVMETFFLLMRIQDKKLRAYLEAFIISDVKNVNSKHQDVKINTVLQNFMFGMTRESNSTSARIALSILMELYRKNIWKNSRVVNVIAAACLRKDVKVMVTAMQFFLGRDPDAKGSDQSDSDSENEKSQVDLKTAKEMIHAGKVKKKSRKMKKQIAKIKQTISKTKKKKKAPGFNFSALHMISDPQGFAEKLFHQLEKLNECFEVKLMHLNLISRLVGIHELLLLPYYSYLQRFLQPHQREVIHLLTYGAQAIHEMVPPDVGEALLRTVANNFVTERNSSEVMAVGLNAIREICARCPLAMTEELLGDLVEYKSHREKAVAMASRSLLTLFREVNPGMLRKKHRGRPTESMQETELHEYGAMKAKDFVPGAEILSEKKSISVDASELGEDDSASDEESDDCEDESSDECVDLNDKEDDDESCDGNESVSDDEEEGVDEQKGEKRKLCESEVETSEQPEQKVMKKEEMAAAITLDRILTQKDFRKIESAQLAKKLNAQEKKGVSAQREKMREAKRLRKRKQAKKPIKIVTNPEEDEWLDVASEESDSDEDADESGSEGSSEEEEDARLPGVVLVKDIEMIHAKKNHDRESRMASVKEGREGREKFGKKFQRMNPTASTSNVEKLKNKPFMMVRQKHKRKQTASFRDRQIRLRNALLKQKRMIVK
ncbi:unnamed protein product [Notodromas monacha]|uniref:Protein SDA1 n=1 Tax=Notodromas monacha TaxID=399045 RepID=A0A7R9BP17_9CRUS|nr:unnamed protein product [Notodromas monacha]CAG0918191.1 unnamed protein product [Notodromas monacha]